MIFTHSYNKQKAGVELAKRGLANAVYVNKMHSFAKNEEAAYQMYKDANLEIIYESPIYISTMITKNADVQFQTEKKGLENELLKSTAFELSNINILKNELKDAWDNYAKNARDDVSKVLTMPIYFLIKGKIDFIKNVIPNVVYKYSSWAIEYSNLTNFDVELFANDVREISRSLNSKNVLLTIKTTFTQIEYSQNDIKKFKSIVQILKEDNITVIFHHANQLLPNLCSVAEFAIGFHNQTKLLSQALPPFLQQDFAKSKSASIFIAFLCSEFKKDKISVRYDYNRKMGISDPILIKIYETFKTNTKNIPKKIKNGEAKDSELALLVNDILEYKKIISATKQERKEFILNGIYYIEGMKQFERKELVYQINAMLFKKMLNE